MPGSLVEGGHENTPRSWPPPSPQMTGSVWGVAQLGGVDRTFAGPFCTEGKGPAQLLLTGQSRCRNSHCDYGSGIQGATCASPSLLPVTFPGRLGAPLATSPRAYSASGQRRTPARAGGCVSRAGPSVIFLPYDHTSPGCVPTRGRPCGQARKLSWAGMSAEGRGQGGRAAQSTASSDRRCRKGGAQWAVPPCAQ